MASITIDSSSDDPSYQLCKTIFLFHPLGQKIASAPVKMAQFLPREITIPDGPEKELVEAVSQMSAIPFSVAILANTPLRRMRLRVVADSLKAMRSLW